MYKLLPCIPPPPPPPVSFINGEDRFCLNPNYNTSKIKFTNSSDLSLRDYNDAYISAKTRQVDRQRQREKQRKFVELWRSFTINCLPLKNQDFDFKQRKIRVKQNKKQNKHKTLHAPIIAAELKALSDLKDIMIVDLAVQEE